MLVRAVISYSLLCMQLWMTTILGVGVGLVEKRMRARDGLDNVMMGTKRKEAFKKGRILFVTDGAIKHEDVNYKQDKGNIQNEIHDRSLLSERPFRNRYKYKRTLSILSPDKYKKISSVSRGWAASPLQEAHRESSVSNKAHAGTQNHLGKSAGSQRQGLAQQGPLASTPMKPEPAAELRKIVLNQDGTRQDGLESPEPYRFENVGKPYGDPYSYQAIGDGIYLASTEENLKGLKVPTELSRAATSSLKPTVSGIKFPSQGGRAQNINNEDSSLDDDEEVEFREVDGIAQSASNSVGPEDIEAMSPVEEKLVDKIQESLNSADTHMTVTQLRKSSLNEKTATMLTQMNQDNMENILSSVKSHEKHFINSNPFIMDSKRLLESLKTKDGADLKRSLPSIESETNQVEQIYASLVQDDQKLPGKAKHIAENVTKKGFLHSGDVNSSSNSKNLAREFSLSNFKNRVATSEGSEKVEKNTSLPSLSPTTFLDKFSGLSQDSVIYTDDDISALGVHANGGARSPTYRTALKQKRIKKSYSHKARSHLLASLPKGKQIEKSANKLERAADTSFFPNDNLFRSSRHHRRHKHVSRSRENKTSTNDLDIPSAKVSIESSKKVSNLTVTGSSLSTASSQVVGNQLEISMPIVSSKKDTKQEMSTGNYADTIISSGSKERNSAATRGESLRGQRKLQPDISVDNSETYSKANLSSALHSKSNGRAEQGNGGRSNTDSWNVTVRADQRQVLPKPAVNTVDDDIDPTIMPIDPTANSKGKKGDFPNDNGLSGQNQMDDTDSQGDDSTGDSINSQASLVADNPDSYELDPPVKTNDLQKAIQDQDLRGLEDLKDTLGSEYKSTMSYFESPDAQQQHAEGKMDESIARIDDKGHAKVVPASKFIHTHSGSDRLKIVVDVPTSNGVNDSLKEREEGSSVGIGKDNTAYKPSKLGVTKKPKGSHQSTGNQEETKGSMAYNSWPLTAQSNPSREKQASERIGDKSSNGYMSENGKVMVPPSYKHPPPDTSVVLPDDPDSIDNEDISNQKISFTLNNDGESNKRKNDQKEQEDMNNAELDFDDVLNSKIRPTPSPRDQTAHYKDHKKQGNMEAKVKGNSRASGLGEASNVSLKEGSRERRPPLLHANEAHETGINTFAAVGDNGKQVIDQEITAFEPNVSNSLNDLTPTQKGYELPLTKGNQEENAIPILTNANTAALTPAVSKEESALRYSFQVLPTISSLEVLQPQKGLGSEGKILKSSQSYMSNGLGESVTGEGGKMNEGNAVDLLGAVTSEPSRQSSEPTHASVTLKRASLPSVPPTKDLVPSAPKRSKGSVKPNVNYLDNAYVLGHANVSRDLVIRPNRREDNVSNARFLSKLKGKSDSVVSSVNRKKERSSKPSQNKTIPHRDDNQQLRIKGGKINGGIVRGGLIMGGYVDGGDIEGGSILGGKVEGGLFKSGVMENGILYNGTVEGGIIRGGKILGGKILSGIIEGGVMKGGLLEGGHLRGGYLEGGAFKGGDMEGGTLKAGEISGGILSNGSVDGGILKGGIIEGGHLLGGVMLGGRLKGGIVKSGLIRGGVIEGGVIEGGVIDEGTVIKGGIYKGNKGNGTEISGSGRSKVAYGYDYKDLQLRDITGDGSNSTSPPVDNNNILGAPESWPLKAKQGPRLEHPSYGRPPMGSPRSTGANFFPRQVKFPEPKPLLWNRKVKSKVSLSKKSFRNSKSNSPSLKVEVNTSDDKPIVKNATSDIRELLIGLEKNLGKQNGKDATRFNIPKESYRGSIIKWPLPSGLQLLAHHFTSNNPVSPYGRSQVSEANDKVSSTAVFEEPYSREIKVMSASVNKSPLNPGKDFPKSAHLHQPKEIDSTPKLPENTIETETFFQKEDRESLTESSVKSTDAKKRKKGSSRSVVTLNDKKESNWYEILGPNGEHYETLGKDITSNITQTALPKQDASLSTTQSDNSYQSDATAQQPISNNDAQSDQTPYDNQKGFKAYPSANDNSSVYNDKQSVQYGTLNNQNKNTVQSNTNTYGVAQPIPDPSYQQQETKGASASYPASKEASTTGQIADNQHSAIVDWDYDDKTASKASVFGQNGRDEMLQKEETEHDYDERRSELIPTLHWSLNKLVSERIPGDPGNPIRISGNVTIHNGIAVLAKGYLDAGDYAGECISDPEVCSDGLTVSMTIKLYKDAVASNSPMYIFDSGASSNDSRGISMWVKGYSIYASLATRFYTWCLDEKLDQFVEKWVAFVLTWRENVGMKLYTNCQLFATSEYGGQCDVCTNCHKVDKNTRLMFGRPNKGPHFRVTHFACGDISIYNHYFDEKEVVLLCGTNNDNGRIEDSTSVQKPNESALKVRHYPAIHNGMYWPTPPHYASLLDTAQNVAEAINVEPTAATPTTPFQARFRLSRPTEIQYYSEENKVFSTDQPIVSPAANQHTVVRGGYSPWSEWSRCTKSCGGGFQFSLRYCNNPMPRNGGADCGLLGPSRQTQACNERSCFIDPDLDFPSTDVPAIGIEPYRNDKRKKSGISQGVQPGKPDGIEKALEFLKM